MSKYICIHGHFYQPPRENPWLGAVEIQESAYPYHDWNARVTAECYERNTFSRILDDKQRIVDIVNNYSKISFNFGRTLLAWMEKESPEVYASILEADRRSQELFSGHGAALAQVYNHIIMPLANSRDKRTQVLWGIRDFESRFGRAPEGMWLAETAVDTESLELMAEYGIAFTILAPHQANRVRKIGEEAWQDVSGQRVDPKKPYMCHLPSGRSIVIFFYDGPIARSVAFEGLLDNGEDFARRLASGFTQDASPAQLVHIATDGETYGHHHNFGEMALSYAVHWIEQQPDMQLTIYGEYLEKHPPQDEVEIIENSSWSCAHGVERWRADCGCCSGTRPQWNQKWRAPLREALDWLRDQLITVYETHMKGLTSDPWALRNAFIDVIMDYSEKNIQTFFQRHIQRDLLEHEQIRVLKLLEMQHNAQLMFTSCGWFFDEVSGIETVQIMQYAARAVQLAKDIGGHDFSEEFQRRLALAPSNVPEYGNANNVYTRFVRPSIVDLLRVGAHFAVYSLFEKYPQKTDIYCYQIQSESYERHEAGRLTCAIGRGWVKSHVTWERIQFSFVAFHLGDHNLIGGVRDSLNLEAFAAMRKEVQAVFKKSDVPQLIALMHKYFGVENYSIWHLFKAEQKKVLDNVLQSAMTEIEGSFRQIYEHHYPLMQIKEEIQVPLPKALENIVEFILNTDLQNVLSHQPIDKSKLRLLVNEMKRWSFERNKAALSFIATQRVTDWVRQLAQEPENLSLMQMIVDVLTELKPIALNLDLWKAQNIYVSIARRFLRERSPAAEIRGDDQEWKAHFKRLGDSLQIALGEEWKVGRASPAPA